MPGKTPADESAASLIGRVLSDRYRLDELVAVGSMGAVYRALHLKMRKAVAVKVLHPESEGFPDLVARFEREAIAGAHINHPNVATAIDMATFDEGSYFLVLELVPGRTLRELIDQEAPLRPARAIKLVKQLAAALGAAHERGIVHRDLKPLNVMVTPLPNETVKLIDFGLARVPVDRVAPLDEQTEASSLSLPGVVFGTVAYMAPETMLGMDAVDERSDLYSLGVILYEMLAGKHPFDPGEPHEVLAQHRDVTPPPIHVRNPGANVPPALEAVAMKLLEKEAAKRYPDVPSLLEALDAGTPLTDESSSRRAFTQAPPANPGVRRGLAAFGVAVVLLGAAALLFIGVTRSSGEQSTSAAANGRTDASSHSSAAALGQSGPAAVGLVESLRTDLVKAADDKDSAEGAAILDALADADRPALKDPALRDAAFKVALLAGDEGGEDAAKVFYALTYRFGSEGLDVLYDVGTRGGSRKAASKANAILEIQGLSQRASPALRIVMELKKASCTQKPLLLARAGTDGDARALAMLEALRPPACDPKGQACCFRRHVGLEKTIDAIRARTGKQP